MPQRWVTGRDSIRPRPPASRSPVVFISASVIGRAISGLGACVLEAPKLGDFRLCAYRLRSSTSRILIGLGTLSSAREALGPRLHHRGHDLREVLQHACSDLAHGGLGRCAARRPVAKREERRDGAPIGNSTGAGTRLATKAKARFPF